MRLRRRGSSAFQKRRLVVLFHAGVAGLVSPFCLGAWFDPLFDFIALYWEYSNYKTCFFFPYFPIVSNYWTYFPQIFRRFL